MPSIVLIDITQGGVLVFSLLEKGSLQKQKSYKGKHPDFLIALENFLKVNKLKLEKISALVLLEGQGSFSGVRHAAAVLNTIHLIKKVNIFGLDVRKFFSFEEIAAAAQQEAIKKHDLLIPIYSSEPNITYPHNKKSYV